MIITLQNLGRRYNREWIFKQLDYTFSSGNSYAILGPNGSGKSTLLKVISGSLTPSLGTIEYLGKDGDPCAVEAVFQQISIAAPYVELIEEFTLLECINFHFQFKTYLPGFDSDSVLALMNLEKAKNKELRFFSSGMKQRVKLALACCSSAALVILDEPTSNLDQEGEAWYLDLVAQTIGPDRILLVGSNQTKEYAFCDHFLNIQSFKNSTLK